MRCLAEAKVYSLHESKLNSHTVSSYFIGYPKKFKDLDFIALIIIEKSGFIFYYLNYNLRIIETENARFIENGEVSGRNESQNMIMEKVLLDILLLTFPLRTFIIVQ